MRRWLGIPGWAVRLGGNRASREERFASGTRSVPRGVCVVLALSALSLLPSRAAGQQPIALTPSLGLEIDRARRDEYGLFPAVDGFVRGRILTTSRADRFRLEIDAERDGRPVRTHAAVPGAEVERARLRCRLVEEAQAGSAMASLTSEADCLRRLAIRFGAAGRTDLSLALAEELSERYPESPEAGWAAEWQPALRDLRAGGSLFGSAGRLDQGGRTELLIFSGYYGVWLGVATPIALDATSLQSVAAGLLLGGSGSMAITHALSRNAPMSRGRASVISLGGHLGTWQGLGWAGIADAEGHDVVGVGVLAGLAGIGSAVALTHRVEFREGPAELIHAGMLWGGWLGLVASLATAPDDGDREGDDILHVLLVTSDAGVLATALLGHDLPVSRPRVRLVSLAGVLGATAGGGLAALAKVDDSRTAIAAVGFASLMGLVVGARLTADYDRGRESSAFESRAPSFDESAGAVGAGGWVEESPALRVQFDPDRAPRGRRSARISPLGPDPILRVALRWEF